MSTPISSECQRKKDFISRLTEWSLRYVPDSMVFVLLLTIIVYLMGLGLTTTGPLAMIDNWVKGFWNLLTFGMQMCVLMITGYVVADARPVKKLLRKLAQWPKNAKQAIIMFTLFTGFTAWLHWGVGMMASLMLARELAVAQKGKGIHYAALAACAYTGTVAAAGPSAAAPLWMATPGHFMEKVVGIIPLGATVFNPAYMALILILSVTIPFLMGALHPKNAVEASDEIVNSFMEVEKPQLDKSQLTPAQNWDRSPILMWIVCLGGLYWIVKFFITKGVMYLDINTVNFTILIFGMILHGTPMDFLESVKRATGTVFGVIIQFPFYAGIFGMISFSGLAEVIANWFVAISTPATYPFVVFVYSGILNFFVPSGGSKFIIEAPYILPAAKQLGASVPYVITAYTNGDMLTNLLQPFWALPLIGALKVSFREILPYGLIVCLYGFIVMTGFYLLILH